MRSLIVFFLLYSSAIAGIAEDVMRASCRVTSEEFGKSGIGSGIVVKESSDKYYILTNGHVIDSVSPYNRSVYVEFFNDGIVSRKVLVSSYYSFYNSLTGGIDAAILEVDKSKLAGYKPGVIPLAPRWYTPKAGQLILGAGCPRGSWLQFWYGRITNVTPMTISFNFMPLHGQSGTGIVTKFKYNNEDKPVVVGLVTWQSPLDKTGSGVSVSALYTMMSFKASTALSPVAEVISDWDKRCAICGMKKKYHFYLYNAVTNKLDTSRLYCPEEISKFAKVPTQYPVPYCNRPPIQKGPPPIKNAPDIGSDDIFGKTPPGNNKNQPSPPPPPPAPPATPDIDKLKNEIQAKNSLIEKLQSQLDSLRKDVENKEKSINELQSKLPLFSSQIKSLESEKQSLFKQVAEKEDELKKAESDKKQLIEKLALLSKKYEGVLNRVNIPGITDKYGGLGTILSAILFALANGTIFALVWHKLLYPYLLKRMGWLPTKILERIGKAKLREFIGEEKEEVVQKIEKNVDKVPVDSNNTVEQPRTEQTVIHNTNIITSDYIRDFFRQNNDTINGISAKEFAIKSGLYKEAVDRLRKDLLPMDRKLYGTKRAADAIEEWVKSQFVNNVKLSDLSMKPSMYHEAYIGFLYWQAVQKLRNGEFNVLGNKDIADAIESFVVNSMYSKMI